MDIPPAPLSIEVSITVEQIFEIVEMDYTFEVHLEKARNPFLKESRQSFLRHDIGWRRQSSG